MSQTAEDFLHLLDQRDQELKAPPASSESPPAPADPATSSGSSPDDILKLLDQRSQELGGGTDQADAVPAPSPSVDTSPLQLPLVKDPIQDPEAGANNAGFFSQPDPVTLKAARAGVVYDKPAPVGHALASFAIDDNEKVNVYKQALKTHFGHDVPVEIGPATGSVEYLDPETNRFALIDPPDRSLFESIPGAAGGSIVMIPELMVGGISALFTKSSIVTALGGGAGAFMGEAMRILMGKTFGINKDVKTKEIVQSAAEVGGTSIAAGLATSGAVTLVQFLDHAFAGEAVRFAMKHSKKLGVSIEEAASLQSQINDTLAAERMRIGANNADLPPKLRQPQPAGKEAKITLGEASGDPDLLLRQDVLKRNSAFQAQFGEFDLERQQAFKRFFDVISKPFSKSRISATETADGIRTMGRMRLGYEQRRATEDLSRYYADADLALQSIDRLPMHQLGEIARNVGDAEHGAFTSRANVLANEIRATAGEAKFVQNTNLAATFKELDDNSRQIFLKALRDDTRKTQMIPSKTIEGPGGEAVKNPIFDPEQKRSFGESWATLSRLKQVIRDGGKSDMDTGALIKIARSIETDLYESANQTELGPMYRAFTGWYRREKMRLDQGTVGNVLQREGGPGGRFTMSSEEVFRNVFPAVGPRGGSGITPTREFMDLIKNDPEAIQGFRNAILDDWRNFVVKDGRVDPARHRQWLDNHSAQLDLKFPGLAAEERSALGRFGVSQPAAAGDPLFTSQELRGINQASGKVLGLEARESANKEVLSAINKGFNAKLANLNDMGQLLNLVRGDLDGQSAGKLMQLLSNPGTLDVRRGLQAEYLKDMRERVATSRYPTTQEPIMNGKALRNFLFGKTGEEGNDRGQIAVIRQLFGNEYANGLTTLEKALTMTQRETVFPNKSNSSAFWTVGKALVRFKFGVITKESRAITGAQQLTTAVADRAMAKALMNPQDMKQLMSIWNQDIRNRKIITILGQFGIGEAELNLPDKSQ